MKKVKQLFYRFYMLKTHTRMQIYYKLVVQACHDFKIFDAHLERRRNKFQVSIYSVQVCQVKLSQTKKFSQLIYSVSLPRTINFMYK